MKTFKTTTLFAMLMLLGLAFNTKAQEVSLGLVESTGGCNLSTDCASNFVCYDILMTVDEDKNLDSYNIWVQYDNTVLSRVNGGDDNSCVLDNGGDTDIEGSGGYRVAGIPGSPFAMTAGVEATVHTICFAILDEVGFDGTTINAGGTMFGVLQTTVTFDDASNDDVPELFPLVCNSETVSCLTDLPVEFLSFDARVRGKVVDLEWKTISEYNNSHFEIERSSNGEQFVKIGSVDSKGEGTNIRDYTFVDKSPLSGHNYYRLKQVDIDAQFDYSEIRSVQLNDFSINRYRMEVFPNPVKIDMNVSFDKQEGFTTIQVLNSNGTVVEKAIIDSQEVGRIDWVINMTDYPTGIYLVRILNAGDIKMSQVVKINE